MGKKKIYGENYNGLRKRCQRYRMRGTYTKQFSILDSSHAYINTYQKVNKKLT
jgi:hypothetical protein